MGSDYPVRVQSMANTDTNDIAASVSQAKRIIQAGGELVRFTAQGTREAEHLEQINHELLAWQGADEKTPLVADIHFQPRAADVAARYVEKVRINPGNYVDSKHFDHIEYSDQDYAEELLRLRDRFLTLLTLCKTHHTALRIGVNHGSLSDRIMSRYGDTPLGMVESCMEFLRICKQEHFDDVVISIKASNTVVMVETVRLLVKTMETEGMTYPLHLGVTEAGDGEDGRIKSAVGIGALLADGIGDTIRVSLSEPPEAEVPVARQLVNYITSRNGHEALSGSVYEPALMPNFRRKTDACERIGGGQVPVVVSDRPCVSVLQPDYTDAQIAALQGVCVIRSVHQNPVGEVRAAVHKMMLQEDARPVIVCRRYDDTDLSDFQLKAAADMGVLLLDGLVDGLWLQAPNLDSVQVVQTAYGILQAARRRMTKTEYISCPSCGRTLYDLQSTIQRIKQATSHLTHLKIGIMGCIVNGPGEMADADYGYVGAQRGHISLYKGQQCVEHNVPEQEAVAHLVALIKQSGDWIEPDKKSVNSLKED